METRTESINHKFQLTASRHSTIKRIKLCVPCEKGARKRGWILKENKKKKIAEESRRRKESRCPFRRPIHNWPHVCNEQLAGRRRSECTCGTMNSDPGDRLHTGQRRWGHKIPTRRGRYVFHVLGPLSAWKTENDEPLEPLEHRGYPVHRH